jgi:hypothetical protein
MYARNFTQSADELLPIQVDRLSLNENRSIFIVRDDLLPAGTKQRAILPLLRNFQIAGAEQFTYASPFAGFAQVALAYGCNILKIPCTLYCERDKSQDGWHPHPFSVLAKQWGAKIVLVDTLSEAEEQASEYAVKSDACKIPLGFQCRDFQLHFQEAISQALVAIEDQIGSSPSRAWLPVGSGTLAHAFHKVAPITTELYCVDVHVLPERDLRLQSLRSLPRIHFFSAEERFCEKAQSQPPIPSNIHYDAKIWTFISEFAKEGDLWWNVAR